MGSSWSRRMTKARTPADGLLAGVPEQGGLADPRLTAEQQAAALAGACAGEQPVDRGRLPGP
jgi:hypothetical protein